MQKFILHRLPKYQAARQRLSSAYSFMISPLPIAFTISSMRIPRSSSLILACLVTAILSRLFILGIPPYSRSYHLATILPQISAYNHSFFKTNEFLIENPEIYTKATSYGCAAYINNISFARDTGEIVDGKELSINEAVTGDFYSIF